jgi:hypothetical protein
MAAPERAGAGPRPPRASIALPLGLAGAMLAGCGAKPIPRDPEAPVPTASAAVEVDPAKVVTFSCTAVDGAEVSTATVAGRATIVAFLTSYDPTSLAEARFLIELAHTHAPRINVVAFVLERPENLPLVKEFAEILAPPFPVCLADADTIAGRGPFEGMNSVPSIAILDEDGHEKYRHLGFQKQDEIEAALKSVE